MAMLGSLFLTEHFLSTESRRVLNVVNAWKGEEYDTAL